MYVPFCQNIMVIIFPLNKGMVIHSYPHLFWVYVPILPGIPKDGRMTIAPYHDHVLRLIKRCCLAGILNMVMISYQPESVGNCGTSPAKMLISIEMMIIGWGMKSKFDGGICRDVDD